MTTQYCMQPVTDLPELDILWKLFTKTVETTVETTVEHPIFRNLHHAPPQVYADVGVFEPYIRDAILEPLRWLMPTVYTMVIQALQADEIHPMVGNNLGTRFAHSMVPLLLNPLIPHFSTIAMPFAAILNLCGIEKASDDLHVLGFEMRQGRRLITIPYRPVLEQFIATALRVIDGEYAAVESLARCVRGWEFPTIASPITSTLQSLFVLLPRERLNTDEIWWVDHPLHATLMLNLLAVSLVTKSVAVFPSRVQTLVLDTLRSRYTGVQAQLADPTMPLEQALEVGTNTILVQCVFAVLVGCVALAWPERYALIEQHWDTLTRAIKDGAGLIRLANDLGPLTTSQPPLERALHKIRPDYWQEFPYLLLGEVRPWIRRRAGYPIELLCDRLLRDSEGREYNLALCASTGQWATPEGIWNQFWQNLDELQKAYLRWGQEFTDAVDTLATDCPELAYLFRSFVAYNDQLYRRGGDYDDVQEVSHGALPVMRQAFSN